MLRFHVADTPAKFDKLSAAPKNDSNELLVLTKPHVGVDQLLAAAAAEVIVLSMRAKGNLERALLSRLERGQKTQILIAESLTKRRLSAKLLDAGARGWYLFSDQAREVDQDVPRGQIVSAEEVDSSEYLLHWTRRRSGPWPDQSLSRYLDELIFGSAEKERGGLAVLRRILATGRILASNDLTRDPRPVVCFSEVSFDELMQRRVFRPHLNRWDFQPFGVAIRKSWLQSQGARQVIYGDEKRWDSLENADRPFFQLCGESSKVDWSQEKEWRMVGDLNLRKLPLSEGVVFVPTAADASQVAVLSRWPVTALTEPE